MRKQQEEKKRKPSGRAFHRKRRAAAGLFLILLLGFGIADYYTETIGLPLFLKNRIFRKLADSGIDMTASSIRLGVFRGLRMTGVVLRDRTNGIRFEAPYLRADLAPLEVFRGVFLPVRFQIEAATLIVPMLPECGKEGAADVAVISGLFADVVGTRGLLLVRNASATAGGIRFQASGTVDNLLHFSFAKLMESARNVLSGGEPPPGEPSVRTDEPASVEKGLVRLFPLEMRKRLLSAVRRLETKRLRESPECSIEFRIDVNDFRKCRATAELAIPSFDYGRLRIDSIRETTTLKNGIFHLDGMKINLGDGSEIRTEGSYDDSGKAVSGKIEGKCRIRDVMLFLDEQVRAGIEEKIVFEGEFVSFRGVLDNFSPADGRYSGTLLLNLPAIDADGVKMKNASVELLVRDRLIEGSLRNAVLSAGGTLAGTFRIGGDGFSCDLSGKAHPADLRRMLPPEAADFIDSKVTFPEDAPPIIEFTGGISTRDWAKRQFSGSFGMSLPNVRVSGIGFRDLSTTLDFSPESVRFKDISARTEEGSRLSGDVLCDLGGRNISARVVCSGAPSKMIPSVEKLGQKQLCEMLSREISWPASGDIVEATAEIYADYGEKPFCRIAGSLIMKDFSYRRIPFRYGAARFLIDSDNRIILPDIVLETADGTLSMKAVYSVGEGEAFHQTPGRFDFTLRSSIRGNDLIRLLYPDWRSQSIDFPYPIRVESVGVIDYADPKKTAFRTTIDNGSCRWAGIRITDIDTRLRYEDSRLSFRGAEGSFCRGRLSADYEYDFSSGRGKLRETLSGAHLTELLGELGIGSIVPTESENGRLSATAEADFEYDENSNLLLFGKGRLGLTGDQLWYIPVLGVFLRYVGEAWPMINAGAVTKIDCDYALQGSVFRIEKIRSDGGLVSIDADGTYQWSTQEFDLRFRAELLKNALPFDAMSKLLTPVSWILSKSVRGKYNNCKWE